MPISLGYLGPTGSYSEAVSKQLFPRDIYAAWTFHLWPSLFDLINAVENGELSLAVIPFENSKNGLLKDKSGRELMAQLAATKAQLRIVAEKFWPLKFILMGKEGAHINNIKTVHVNPFAQEQCQDFFKQYSHWQIQAHNSSSEAAKAAKESDDASHAALASIDAMREYHLVKIHDELFAAGDEPIMHFLVLSNGEKIAEESFDNNVSLESQQNCISSFAVKAECGKKLTALAHQKLDISMVRQSNALPDHYYIDVKGKFSPTELEAMLESNSVIHLGTFTACEERQRYQKQFAAVE